MTALLAAAPLALVSSALAPAAATAQVAAPVVTAQPATGVGLDVNWTSVPGAAGYGITATDNAGGTPVTDSCFACNHIVITGLTILHFYTVSVVPVNSAGSPVGPAGTAVSATYYDLPPFAVASLSATPMSGDQLLQVSWAYNTGGVAADKVNLELHSVDAAGASTRIASTTVYRTVEPNQYVIPVLPGRWVVKAIPSNRAGFGPSSQTAIVTVDSSCVGATLCARVTTGGSAVRLAGQGFLFGLFGQISSTMRAAISALRPQQWRFSGSHSDAAARTFNVSRTHILSDLWFGETSPGNGGYASAPWTDWARWRNFVTATVNRARSEGWAPDYWDVWNEPNGTCCPKFSSADLSTVTTARWLQTFEEAWRAIKAADPQAKIVGPSTSSLQWTAAPWPDPAPEFDLDTFLDYSADKGLVWDAVTWHESDLQPLNGDISYTIVNVSRHLQLAKAVIARHPGTVVNGRIFVNEYAPPEIHALAGWTVAYLRALEEGGVVQANRSCWSTFECEGAGLDGLFTSSGQTTGAWWAHRLYADLAGGAPMTVQSNVSWQFDGLAARDDTTKTVRALIGRHWWCNRAVNGSWCSSDLGVTAVPASVTIDWPYGTEPVGVTVQRIPAGTGALTAPVVVSSAPITPVSGVLTVPVPSVADGDALSIVATLTGTPPSTTTPPTTSPPTTSTTTPTTTAPPTTTQAGGTPILSSVTAAQGPTGGSIKLTWTAAQPNGAPVTSYAAACVTSGQAPKSVATNGSTLTATITGLSWWRSYSCAVSATNQFGTSAAVAAQPSSLRPRM